MFDVTKIKGALSNVKFPKNFDPQDAIKIGIGALGMIGVIALTRVGVKNADQYAANAIEGSADISKAEPDTEVTEEKDSDK